MNPLTRLWRKMFGDPDAPPAPDDLVLLARTRDGEAVVEMWRGMLASQGIPSVPRGDFALGRVYGFSRTPASLYVRYGDLPRAREVLSEIGVADEVQQDLS